ILQINGSIVYFGKRITVVRILRVQQEAHRYLFQIALAPRAICGSWLAKYWENNRGQNSEDRQYRNYFPDCKSASSHFWFTSLNSVARPSCPQFILRNAEHVLKSGVRFFVVADVAQNVQNRVFAPRRDDVIEHRIRLRVRQKSALTVHVPLQHFAHRQEY